MFARALYRFHPAHLHAPGRPTSNSFISPTYARLTRNSFVSPTYAKTGGCTPSKMSARRHFFSLSSQSPHSVLFLFNCLRTLSFSVSQSSAIFPTPSALLPEKHRVHPLWSNQSHALPVRSNHSSPAANCRLSTVDCWLLHSPRIHKSVTGASPNNVRGLSQWRPVRGPTLTPCLSLSHRVRYTSTNALRPARSLHETCTDH
jgi:hypothetical protein